MSDDDCGVRGESVDGFSIDLVASGHFVGDAVQFDGIFRDCSAGLVERAEFIEDGSDRAVAMIGELDHAKFDHFVGGGIQSGGFNVE